jgi:hypothetical protein
MRLRSRSNIDEKKAKQNNGMKSQAPPFMNDHMQSMCYFKRGSVLHFNAMAYK